MNFTEAANEAVNWASNHVEGALMVGAVFTAAAAIAFVRLRDHFTPPTPTAFDDLKIKATRERIRERFKRLGLPYSEP